MLKKLVIQLAVKLDNPIKKKSGKIATFSYLEEMYTTSEEHARKYAKKCNADYYVITDPNDWIPGTGAHVAFQKFKVYDFLNYDRILYIDSDYIIKDTAPNIFDIVDNFAAIVDPGKTEHLAKNIGIPATRYFNSGFLHFTKEILEKSKDEILKINLRNKWQLKDQAVWNKVMYDLNIDFIKLDSDSWNPSTKTFGLYGDHYSGTNKNKWGSVKY
jgi:lipopolysaccharide biosynthesis glycosyltransferase